MTAEDLKDKTILVTNGATLTCKGNISFTEEGCAFMTNENLRDHYDVVVDKDVTIEDSIVCKVIHVAKDAQTIFYAINS